MGAGRDQVIEAPWPGDRRSSPSSEKEIDKLKVLKIVPTIAHTIKAVFEEALVSELFHGENQP